MPTTRNGDPWLKHPTWRTAVAHWRTLLTRHGLTCARCGQPINPSTRRGPWSLDVGHIVPRAQARLLGWTVEQANAISNTQAEHQRCSRSAGATDGNALRRTPPPPPLDAADW